MSGRPIMRGDQKREGAGCHTWTGLSRAVPTTKLASTGRRVKQEVHLQEKKKKTIIKLKDVHIGTISSGHDR